MKNEVIKKGKVVVALVENLDYAQLRNKLDTLTESSREGTQIGLREFVRNGKKIVLVLVNRASQSIKKFLDSLKKVILDDKVARFLESKVTQPGKNPYMKAKKLAFALED